MLFTPKQIDEIAQEIEAGMKVYINLNTHEIKSIIDWEAHLGIQESGKWSRRSLKKSGQILR